MVTRADIVAETLEWIGTPGKWGQSAKRRGTDCKGLIFGVARELGMPEALHPLAAERSYRRADSGLLLRSLREILIPADEAREGDVLVIEMGKPRKPCHLAVKINDRELVHCYGRSIDKVVRVPIGHSRPIHSVWSWPSLGGE